MPPASRFPRLALPFGLIGAFDGHLCGRLLANRVMHQTAPIPPVFVAAVAAIFGAALGALLHRWCAPPPNPFELDEPPADGLPDSDRWWRHLAAMIACGIAVGVVTCSLGHAPPLPWLGAMGGFWCAVALCPVGIAVIAVGRRARRARQGSIVAASDRRAVYGILAATSGVTTLAALPDWPAFALGHRTVPWSAMEMLAAALATTVVVLHADLRALGEIRQFRRGLTPVADHESPESVGAVPEEADLVDLGLESQWSARVADAEHAYRGRETIELLVHGNADAAARTLRWAIARNVVALVVLSATVAAHCEMVSSDEARSWYFEEAFHRKVPPYDVWP